MAKSTFIAQFAVFQSTRDVDAQVAFYQDIGYVIDHGYDVKEDIPDEYFTARGVSKAALTKTVALRLPYDPYMHLIIFGWKDLKTTPGWPAPFNQVGSRGLSMLVRDVKAELARIKEGWPHLKVLYESITVRRAWGLTTSSMLVDPEGVFLELIEIEKGSPFDPANTRPPSGDDRTWLHFMYLCTNYKETKPFYEAFNMRHDHGVDFRPEVGFHPRSLEYFADQMMQAFEFDMMAQTRAEKEVVAFLWSESDCSQMHLELINGSEEKLKVPGPTPTWSQRGIARYCIKTKDYAGALAKAKARGTRIYIEDQRGCLGWGDSQWFFFADTDGNIVTLEEWFPYRQWGEKA